MKSETVLAVLQWLAVLACPLMMLWCMRGLSDRGCHKGSTDAEGASAGSERQGSSEAEIQALKARLARLEAERANPRREADS